MGLFKVTYGFDSTASESVLEARVKRQVISDACNQGYTPNGEPSFTWNVATKIVKVTLPVAERTP